MNAEEIWRQKSDDELLKAGSQLADYTEDGQRIVLAELGRRGLDRAMAAQFVAAERVVRKKYRPSWQRVLWLIVGSVAWVVGVTALRQTSDPPRAGGQPTLL